MPNTLQSTEWFAMKDISHLAEAPNFPSLQQPTAKTPQPAKLNIVNGVAVMHSSGSTQHARTGI